MALSLGSLYVELKANTAQFLDGMSKAGVMAGKTGRDIQKGLGQVGQLLAPLGAIGTQIASVLDTVGVSARRTFSSIAGSGIALGAFTAGVGGVTALGGALFALAEKSANLGAKIYDASLKTGIAAGQMSAMMALAKETGGDFDGLTTSLARASVNLAKTAEGGGKLNPLLYAIMGGAKNAAELGLKPMGDRIQTVLESIFKLSDEGKRNEALSQLMGRGWMQNVAALKAVAEQGYAPAIAQAQKFGMYFNDESARQARQFKSELAEITATASGFGLTIGQKVVPSLVSLMTQLVGMAAMMGELQKHISLSTALLPGGGLVVLAEAAKHSSDMLKAGTQAMTDFLVHAKSLTDGAKGTAEAQKSVGKAVEIHADALAELIAREKDELATLDIHNKAERAAADEYDRTVREIEKAVRAHGSLAEAYMAGALALDIYYKKLAALWPILSKLPREQALAMLAPPMGAAIPGQQPPPFQTINDFAKARTAEESLTTTTRYLRMEENLSTRALAELAKAFGGLTPYEIAASAGGERMIRVLGELDRQGGLLTFGEEFRINLEKMQVEGEQFGKNLADILKGAIGQWEDQFARMVVTGKGNFKQLGQGIEEQLVKAGLQFGVSKVLGAAGIGGKPDGSAGNPLHVIPHNASGGLLKGGLGGGATGGVGGSTGPFGSLFSNFSSTFKGIEGVLSKIFSGAGSVLGKIAGLFGGFLQAGGDVTPGHAYVVGEKHAEWFVPKAAGRIAPSISTSNVRPLVLHQHWNISTPDPDSFKRSQSQIIAEATRAAMIAHGRHS
jgi:hypothetical protein